MKKRTIIFMIIIVAIIIAFLIGKNTFFVFLPEIK